LFDELDIIVADVEVLVDEVEADPRRAPLGIEEESPNPVQAGDSGAVAARCGHFPPLLCLRDRSNRNVGA
jgi:predicted butyrate kinase (DUF1464 family)